MLSLVMLPAVGVAQTVNCANPVAQVEINYCAEEAFLLADAELNALYKQARAAMRDVDASIPAPQRGAENALRDAQRAWITFRDQACLAEAYTWFGGSGQPMVYSGCRARLTEARVMDLRGLVEGY
ncbi:MAG: lysozyme inhibitor LprI family protein [Paracoccaceae bacterium]